MSGIQQSESDKVARPVITRPVIEVVLDTNDPPGSGYFDVHGLDMLKVDQMVSDAKMVEIKFHRLLAKSSDGIYTPAATLHLDQWVVPYPWRLSIRDRRGLYVRRVISATEQSVSDSGPQV